MIFRLPVKKAVFDGELWQYTTRHIPNRQRMNRVCRRGRKPCPRKRVCARAARLFRWFGGYFLLNDSVFHIWREMPVPPGARAVGMTPRCAMAA